MRENVNLITRKILTERCMCVHAPLCLTLCDPSLDCNPAGSSIYGISQAGTLERGAIPFSRGSSQPRD